MLKNLRKHKLLKPLKKLAIICIFSVFLLFVIYRPHTKLSRKLLLSNNQRINYHIISIEHVNF